MCGAGEIDELVSVNELKVSDKYDLFYLFSEVFTLSDGYDLSGLGEKTYAI